MSGEEHSFRTDPDSAGSDDSVTFGENGWSIASSTNVAVENGAVVPATATVVDDFEDGDIAEFTGDTGTYSVVTDRTYSGSYALYNGGNNDTVFSTSGLDTYPTQGDTIELRTYHGDDEAGSSISFGVQDGSNFYRAGYHGDGNSWFVWRFEGGTKYTLTSVSDASPPAGQWWRWEVDWGTDGSIVFTAEEDSGSEIAQLSATDGTWTSGGIGFSTAHQSGNHDHWWDQVRIL